MKTETYPLAVPEDLLKEMRQLAKDTGLSMADAMRQSMKLGAPKLKEQLSAQHGRITNVEPLPKAVLEKLYAERVDDEEGIRRLMAAQPKDAE